MMNAGQKLELRINFKCKSHEFPHFIIDVFICHHAKVMIVLLLPRYLCYFLKTKVIMIGLIKMKNHMNEILSQLRDVANAFS